MFLPALLLVSGATFVTFEGDVIRLEYEEIGGGASVVAVVSGMGWAASVAQDECAEVELNGRRFQWDGSYVRQLVGGAFVDLRREGEFGYGFEDTMDGGPGTNGPGVPAHEPGWYPPKKPEDHDDDWTTMTREEWHWNFPGEPLPPRRSEERTGEGAPRGGGGCGDCGAPPPGELGVGETIDTGDTGPMFPGILGG